MSKSKILFNNNAEVDASNLLQYLDHIGPEMGFQGGMEVDDAALMSAINGMYEMPWWNDPGKASPFKKVAAFTTNFTQHNPIGTTLPKEIYGDLWDHQNAIIAYEVSRDALHEGVIQCKYRGKIELAKKIVTSKHYWREMIAMLSASNPRDHFSCVSLLYEQLTYNANPDASYAKLYGRAYPEMIH